MAGSVSARTVQTVLGEVAASSLGRTHTHEHLLVDLTPGIPVDRMSPEELALLDDEITLENYYEVRRNHRNRSDCTLDDEELAVQEMRSYREAGGGAIVEATPVGAGRNPEGLARISSRSGVHVIIGTGYYLSAYHPPEIATAAVDQISAWMRDEIVTGISGTNIRAGIIGEIGMSWPPHPDEEKVLQAAARAQAATGVPLLVHPGMDVSAPLSHVSTIEESGGDVSRVIMSHIDRTLFEIKDMVALAKTGCYLEIDLFGRESAHHPFAPIDMLNDAARVDVLLELFAAGYGEQVVIAQDICHKTNLTRYGGEGYAHILSRIVPVMQRKGMSSTDIDTLLIDNPRRILSRESS